MSEWKNEQPGEGPALDTELEPGYRPPSRLDPLAERPTETLSGLAGATLLYGWLAERGLPNGWAIAISLAAAFVPAGISDLVDVLRDNREAERLEQLLREGDGGDQSS